MKFVICSSSAPLPGAASAKCGQSAVVAIRGQFPSSRHTELGDIGSLAEPLVAASSLPERVLRSGYVENVIHDLKQHAKLGRKRAE